MRAPAGCLTWCGRPCTTTTPKRRWRASLRQSPRLPSAAPAKQPHALKIVLVFQWTGHAATGRFRVTRDAVGKHEVPDVLALVSIIPASAFCAKIRRRESAVEAR